MDYIFYQLHKAKKESLKSTHPKVKIGVVVVKNGKIISRGFNQMRHTTLRKYSKWSNSLHAEVHALSKLTINQSEKATMYIYREDRNYNLAMCKPCPTCQKFITDMKIKKIIYTISKKPGFIIEKC